ncbi:MAG TPA: HAMP domain-containing sensor histidine kinase [Clostridia bacterium]|nr:HAMP domain-containing sensor histidine kinase [Clostridia bacterium]
MDYGYLFAIAVILIIALLAFCLASFVLYRKSLLQIKSLTDQLNTSAEAVERKSEFFSNMAHELKTPLSVILGAVQLLGRKEGEQSESSFTKNLMIISCNCYRLLRLTNNLLDLNRIEAGYLSYKPVNCDLNQLISEIVQSVRPFASNRMLSLNYCGTNGPIFVAVDIEKMERIMLNLLSNAIKFTKPGGLVLVSVYVSGERACISVKDSGTGIPEESREMIFERYRQAGRDSAAENEGSGIGLSLVRSFVKLHQGNIRLSSEKDNGTEFIIDLPLKQLKSADVYESEELGASFEEAAKIEFSTIHTVPM